MHFDAHVHSAASPDSELCPLEAIRVLKAKGLGIAFTEHADFVTPTEGRDPKASDVPTIGKDFTCDFDIYPSQYLHLKQDNPSVLIGIEIGLSAAYLPLNTQTANNKNFDFVLGALHFVDGHDVYSEASSMDAREFCRRYLVYGKEMVELGGFFDSFAHIDYITRYSQKINKLFLYKNFSSEFDGLLKALADRDIALEINTTRFGDKSAVGQLAPIYKRYKALGGKYVTIGSDAHATWGLGRYYKAALGLADIAGLEPVYYRERKRYKCD